MRLCKTPSSRCQSDTGLIVLASIIIFGIFISLSHHTYFLTSYRYFTQTNIPGRFFTDTNSSQYTVDIVDSFYNKYDQDIHVRFRDRFLDLWDNLNSNVGLDSLQHADKFIIYRCGPGMMACGGWADRVKGMIVGYLMANLTGRVFKIDFHDPDCDITRALIPNKVDWRLPIPFHKIVSPYNLPPDTVVLDYLRNPKDLFKFDTLNVSTIFNQSARYVYMKANLDYIEEIKRTSVYPDRLAWMKYLRKNQIFSEFYRRLFRLSPEFQNKLRQFLGQHVPTDKHKLVCAHIRMGQNPNIPQSYEQVRMLPEFLPNVWKFISEQSVSDLDKVFIMSDSNDTMSEASRQIFASRMITTPGKILHIEYAKTNGTESRCEALEKVIFDQAVLMNCDVLLISKSGLSRMAAFVRGSDQDLYCLFPSGTISKCRSDEFTSLYHITG